MSGKALTAKDLAQACEKAKKLWMAEFDPRKRGTSREISAIFDAGMSVLVCLQEALLEQEMPAEPEPDDDFAALAAADPEIHP